MVRGIKCACGKLKTGFYECTIPADAESVNAPKDIHGSAYLAEINITESLTGRKQIILLQNYTKDVWLKPFTLMALTEVGFY